MMTIIKTMCMAVVLFAAFGLSGCEKAENTAEGAVDEVKNIADDTMDAAEGAAEAVDRQF